MLTLGAAAMAQGNGTWTLYNTKNSDIGSNNIAAVAADNKGAWVGTYQGLCRLNGASWLDYAMFNEKLKDQFVNCLVVEGNRLWIGTDDYGVIEFNGTRWTEHTEETRKLNMKYIRDIAVDHAGVKWIGVTLSGFVQYDGVNWTKYTVDESGLLSDFILCTVVDNRDRKWIGTNDGLCVFDGNRWSSYTVKNSRLPHNICLSIAIDRDNVKWIGTLEGLCRFDGKEWKVYNTDNCPLPGNQINGLAIDGEGLLWMATDGGVAVFDRNDRWEAFPAGRGELPKCMYQNVVVDNKGNHWFGTDEKGLFCLSNYKMREKDDLAEVDSGNSGLTEDSGTPEKTGKPGKNGKKEQASDDKVRLTPYLDEGYITLTMSAPVAEVVFYNAKGDKVRTVPKYQNGARLSIAKMKKGTYTIKVNSGKGTRTVKFTIK